MIAGGSGITPMLQIIEAMLRNRDDNTKLALISPLYANVSPDDILLKKKLDVLEDSHPNLKNWRGGTEYISKDMAVKGLPGPSEDFLILLTGILKELGYTEDMVYKF